MRILQINNFEDIRGGSDRVFQLTTKLLLDQGHEVATLACGDRSFDDRKRSVLLRQNGYFSKNPLTTLRNIRQFVYRDETAEAIETLSQTFRPDIAHLHIFYGQLSSSVLQALKNLGIPCVMTVHEYRMLCPISTMYTQKLGVCERCATGQRHHAVIHRCNRGSALASALSAWECKVRDSRYDYPSHIDRFLMVSEFCRRKHVEFMPTIENQSTVLYNFVADKDVAAQPTPIDANAPFLFAGRLSHEKGVALLCDAFSKRPDLTLHIAGTGPLDDTLRQRFEGCPNILFLGKLDAPALREAFSRARFSIVPSEWYENNPMSILECFSVGTPVLGAAIGGIPELVIDDTTGYLFEASDEAALGRAIDRAAALPPEQRHAMGLRAIEMIRQRHTESAYYERLLAEYETARTHHGTR
ncbi:glycosyltransferase family 4 protein [Roseateles sp.]|uniref:glycosyltransferase family 4 protein n=1 Tax=Roseateles sp. TaxID=1971397 RepID=UPI002F41FD4F